MYIANYRNQKRVHFYVNDITEVLSNTILGLSSLSADRPYQNPILYIFKHTFPQAAAHIYTQCLLTENNTGFRSLDAYEGLPWSSFISRATESIEKKTLTSFKSYFMRSFSDALDEEKIKQQLLPITQLNSSLNLLGSFHAKLKYKKHLNEFPASDPLLFDLLYKDMEPIEKREMQLIAAALDNEIFYNKIKQLIEIDESEANIKSLMNAWEVQLYKTLQFIESLPDLSTTSTCRKIMESVTFPTTRHFSTDLKESLGDNSVIKVLCWALYAKRFLDCYSELQSLSKVTLKKSTGVLVDIEKFAADFLQESPSSDLVSKINNFVLYS
jgi:hypothetical protein